MSRAIRRTASEHSMTAITTLRALRDGGGGQCLVVLAEPGEGFEFPAGLHQPPVGSALESVLSYIADTRVYDRVVVFSGMNHPDTGHHLPSDLIVGEGLMVGTHPGIWELRGVEPVGVDPTRDASVRPAGLSKLQATMAESLKDGQQRHKAGRPGRQLNRFEGQRDWYEQFDAILSRIFEAIGRRFDGDQVVDGLPPDARRTLLILDEDLLIPRTDQVESVVGMQPWLRLRVDTRLNGLPRALRGTSADLILLVRSRRSLESLRRGLMIHDQVYRMVWQGSRVDVPAGTTDARLPQMRWKIEDAPDHELARLPVDQHLSPHLRRDGRGLKIGDALRNVAPRKVPDPMEALDSIIGLPKVKDAVRLIFDTARDRQARLAAGIDPGELPVMHAVFSGNPGTGKTYVAGIMAQVLVRAGLLRGTQVTSARAADLVAGYVGQTRIKTRELCERASGGVLFIDEAYALAPGRDGSNSFGAEAVDELIVWMNDRRQDLLVIFAGYRDLMRDFVQRSNPGLRRRIGFEIEFSDYTSEELVLIGHEMLRRTGERFAPGGDEVIIRRMREVKQILEAANEQFGNAGEVEKLILAAKAARGRRLYGSGRTTSPTAEEIITIRSEDLENARLDLPGGGPS